MVGKAMSGLLPDEVEYYISKALTQRWERTKGILRQQTGRWHRLQNKFGKLWQLFESNFEARHQLLQLVWAAFVGRELQRMGEQN
jgi:hypothetical protein